MGYHFLKAVEHSNHLSSPTLYHYLIVDHENHPSLPIDPSLYLIVILNGLLIFYSGYGKINFGGKQWSFWSITKRQNYR